MTSSASTEHPVAELIAARAQAGSRPGARSDGARLALAVEGGGMRGAITGGMLFALYDLGLLDVFDAVYGASSGALNGAWFVAGAGWAMNNWSDDALRTAAVKRANLLRGRPLFDGVYLTEVVYEQLSPMPFERIIASEISLHPLATDILTGEAVDLAPMVTDRASLKLALRASTALPLLSGRPVAMGGRQFFDAGLSEAIPWRTASRHGATHILVLRSRRLGQQEASDSGRIAGLVARYLARHSTGLAEAFLGRPARLLADDDELDARERDPRGGSQILSVRPASDTPTISRLERRHELVVAGLQAGEGAMRALLPRAGAFSAS